MKIGILNHLGGGNLGDDATFDALAQNIKARRPDAIIHAFTMNPDDSRSRHNVPSHPIRRERWTVGSLPETSGLKVGGGEAARKRKPFGWFLKRACGGAVRLPVSIVLEMRLLLASRRLVKELDLLIIGGGGQLTERDGAWAFPYTLLKWVLLAKSCGVSCAFVNVGAGPISSRIAKFFTVRALDAADYVSFRDLESQDLARRIGFSGVSEVYPDSVYCLDFSQGSETSRAANGRPVVGISPVPCGDRGFDPKTKGSSFYTRVLAQWTALIRMLAADGYSVRLFGTDIGSDFVVIEDILAALRKEGVSDLPEVCEVSTLDELLASMVRMDYVITSRFHGIVFAHLLRKPVLAFANHHKVDHLMSSLGLSDYCQDLQNLDPVGAFNQFRALVNDAEGVKTKMDEKLAQNRARLALQFDQLFPAMGSEASEAGTAVELAGGLLRTRTNRI